MGSPPTPSSAQRATLEKAGQLQMLAPPQRMTVTDGKLLLTFNLPRQGVSLVKVTW